MRLRAPRSLTVRAGLAAGGALLTEAVTRGLDRLDLIADVTADLVVYTAQGVLAVSVVALAAGIRRAIGASK